MRHFLLAAALCLAALRTAVVSAQSIKTPDTCAYPADWKLNWKCNCSDVKAGFTINLPFSSADYPPVSSFGGGARTRPYKITTNNRGACCNSCTNLNAGSTSASGGSCAFWLHYIPGTLSACGSSAAARATCGHCVIFPPGFCPKTGGGVTGLVVGKGCIQGKNDPHFVGAHGTNFDFNGLPNESFCLVTDPEFQVNMKMTGYYDERTYGATILKDGKAVRTWIKDLGFMWIDPQTRVRHTMVVSARSGKASERGDGFVDPIAVDGVILPRIAAGDKLTMEGGLTITYEGPGTEGAYDADVYRLDIEGILSMEIRARVAHPLLQTPTDAMAHLNVQFDQLKSSPQTHGVLGQTFLEGREKRALDYTLLAGLSGRKIAADSELGSGFLDGRPEDYVTPDVLSPLCKFSAFGVESQ